MSWIPDIHASTIPHAQGLQGNYFYHDVYFYLGESKQPIFIPFKVMRHNRINYALFALLGNGLNLEASYFTEQVVGYL